MITPVMSNIMRSVMYPVMGRILGPCVDGLEMWVEDTWIPTESQLLGLSATGDHVATKAQYLDIDVTYTIAFAGMSNGVTISSHGGTATVDLTNGLLTCSVAGTLFNMVLSDGSTYSCGEGTTAGITIVPDQVGGIQGTLVGFTIPGDRSESSITGHTWNGSGYSFDVTDGVELVVNGDASDTSSTDSSVAPIAGWGNTGTHNTANKITIESGKFHIISDGGNVGFRQGVGLATGLQYKLTYTGSDVSGVIQLRNFGGATTLDTVANGAQSVIFIADDAGITLTRGGGVCDGKIENISVERFHQGYIPADPTNPALDVFGNALTNPGTAIQPLTVKGFGADLAGTETFSMARLTGTETVVLVGTSDTSTPTVVAGGLTFTAGVLSYVELSDGTELIFQNSSTSTGIIVWNGAVSTNDFGTLVGAVTPVFTAEIEQNRGPWIGLYGGRLDTGNIIPGLPNSSLAADGNVKTFVGVHDAPADTLNEYFAETLEMTEAVPGYFTAGVADGIDPSTITDGDEGGNMRISPKAQIVTDPVQTGKCKEQTDKYLEV